MQSRPWLWILQSLPTPFRWIGMEFVRLIHWLDHLAGRVFVSLRTSPAWFFVTTVGMLGIGLTIVLFVSMIEHPSIHRSQAAHARSTVTLGREDLEKNHDWSVQDHWRIAHFFVPHRPAKRLKDIEVDSRLVTSGAGQGSINSRTTFNGRPTNRATNVRSNSHDDDFDVRLDLSRPKIAQQGNRVVKDSILDLSVDAATPGKPRIRLREPQLLVQAWWDFGADCRRYDPVSLPIRRPMTLLQPEPEMPPRPARRAMPDLSFAMEMTRHFSLTGHFPPGSYLISQSDRSVFPADESRFQNELVSYGRNDWQQFDSTQKHWKEEVVPYTGAGDYEPMPDERLDSDESDQTLPAIAQVNLRLELVTPHAVAGGRLNHLKLLVENEGQASISRIEILDQLSQLQTVVSAEPEAAIESAIDSTTGSRANLLHREIQSLVPGDGREFILNWIPEGGRRQIHHARVIAHAAVSTTTDVNRPAVDQQMPSIPPESEPANHPALACDVDYVDRVRVGEDVELEITVRNTGDTTLHDVQVRVEVPDQFSHRDGRTIVFEAGTLQMREKNQTKLTLAAKEAGNAVNSLHVSTAEKIKARGNTRILVVEREKEPEVRPQSPETIQSAPVNRAEPTPKPLIDQCCCQRVAMQQAGPMFQLP